jgi:hypothetical protein
VKVIYKYTIHQNIHEHLEMPKGAEILHSHMLHGELRLWALVDPDQPIEGRVFRIFVTGEKTNFSRHKYIDTFIAHDGNFVGHLFEQVDFDYED